MDTVQLKNGTEEAKPAVMATMLSLEHLASNDPTVLYDLLMRCQDRDYQWFGDNQATAEKLSLMLPNNHIDDTVKNIVLSAVTENGLDISLGNPVAV